MRVAYLTTLRASFCFIDENPKNCLVQTKKKRPRVCLRLCKVSIVHRYETGGTEVCWWKHKFIAMLFLISPSPVPVSIRNAERCLIDRRWGNG